MKKKYIKICPQCKSPDIGIPPAGMDLRLTFPDYCRKCKNIGIFPEVELSKFKKLRKAIKK